MMMRFSTPKHRLLPQCRPVWHGAPTEDRERLLSRVASDQHGVFTLSQALACGFSHRAVEERAQRGQYDSILPGVYAIAGSRATWLREVAAAVLSVNARAAASHQTAAFMWGMTPRKGDMIDVVTTRWDRVHRSNAAVHESRDLIEADVVQLDGIPITQPARTVVDLGATSPAWLVESCLDNALRLELFTIWELQRFVRRVARRGRRGVGTIRPLLEARLDQRSVTESELEDLYVRVTTGYGLPEPTAQYQVINQTGQIVCRADFAYPDHKLLVELDSERYHLGRDAFHRDRAKQNETLELGWRTLRFTWRDLIDEPARVRSVLAYVCAS
jgi:predicted transcriptional regulator of viral defense system